MQTLEIDPASFATEFRYSRNHFLTLQRMCRLYGAERGHSEAQIEAALRKALAARGERTAREHRIMSPAELGAVRSR